MFGPNNIQNTKTGALLYMAGTNDPTVIATDAISGTLYVRYSDRTPNPVGLYQKQDDGLTTNWSTFPISPVITGAISQGSGSPIYNGVSGTTLLFKSLTVGSLLSLDTSVAGEIKIVTYANQVVSVGGGYSLIDGYSGLIASFRSINGSGVGQSLISGVFGSTINFKDLIAGSGISLTPAGNSITINNTASPATVTPLIINADYVVGANDTCILANSSSPINLTLPNAVTFGKRIELKNIGTGFFNLNPILSQNIDNFPNFTLNSQYQAITLIPAGGQWYIW